jgi:hypothetical protein
MSLNEYDNQLDYSAMSLYLDGHSADGMRPMPSTDGKQSKGGEDNISSEFVWTAGSTACR